MAMGEAAVAVSQSANIDLSGGDNPSFSLFQKNCVAVRVERNITWKLGASGAAAYISGVEFGGSPS